MLDRTETSVTFNLDLLTEFNPAIAYGFDPEASPEGLLSKEDTFRSRLLPEAPQYQDMLNAYLYAQDALLPAFRSMEEAPITAEGFLEQLNVLHSKIAKTVHSNLGLTAGKYTSDIVLRWHAGCGLEYDICFLDMLNRQREPSKNQIAEIAKKYDLQVKELQTFIKLIYRLRDDSTISILKKTLDPMAPANRSVLLIHKLCIAYLSERLTAEEKRLVDGIVTICQHPDTLPAAMAAYAHKTLDKLRACDRENLDEVALFLAESFFELTEIHPYPNGNGRLATCVMNIFLRYFNLPSILLRLPGESRDASSVYARAIEKIKETRAPLAILIKKRIIDIQSKGAFTDEELKTISSLRVTLSERIKELLGMQPEFPIDNLLNEGDMPRLCHGTVPKKEENKQTILQCREILRLVNVYIARFREKHSSSAMTAAGFSLAEPKFTAEEKPQILNALNAFAKLSDWKLNIKAGAFWTESEDENAARALLKTLTENGAKAVTLSKRTDNTRIWVVMCKDVAFARGLLHEAAATTAHGADAAVSVAAAAPC